MNKGIKIFAALVILLGAVSGIFLLTAKKKTPIAPAVKNTQTNNQAAPAQKKPVEQNNSTLPANNNAQAQPNRKEIMRSQWQQCKDGTIAENAKLFWNVQISEGIPAGGTYAKGFLDNDSAFAVRVIIKPDSKFVDKIKQMLEPGKVAILKGNCTDVASDGSVVLEVF